MIKPASEVKHTAKHTPGPWAVIGNREESELDIVQESTGGLIATTESTLGYGDADQANANLMAAAPDMLEALERSVKHLCCVIGFESLVQQQREAISKARGRGETGETLGRGGDSESLTDSAPIQAPVSSNLTAPTIRQKETA